MARAHLSCAWPSGPPVISALFGEIHRRLAGFTGVTWPRVAIRQERCKIRHVALPRSNYAFLTLPRYSMIALSNAVEPLRMANIITGESVYQWSIVSLDGQPTPASNGLQLSPTVALELLGPVDILSLKHI